MPQYEPFWDTKTGRWPGLYDTNGKPRNAGAVYESHIGVWCEWDDYEGLGVVASSEFQFTDDGRFVWFSLSSDDRSRFLVRREGSWKLTRNLLSLQVTDSEEPEVMPRRRLDLRIDDRKERLALRTVRLDDEPGERDSYFLLPARAGDAARVLETALAKKRQPAGALPKPYSSLETLLKMSIPAAIKKLNLPEPAFCVRLYYYDTHCPREGYALGLRILTETLRRELVAANPDPANLEEELWHPLSGAANGIPGESPGLYEAGLCASKELMKYFGEIYDRLCESEDEHMPHLRELARRVSKALNARNWDAQTPVSDDFVVFPADGSGFFGGEYLDDLEASVPAERVELLRQREYLA